MKTLIFRKVAGDHGKEVSSLGMRRVSCGCAALCTFLFFTFSEAQAQCERAEANIDLSIPFKVSWGPAPHPILLLNLEDLSPLLLSSPTTLLSGHKAIVQLDTSSLLKYSPSNLHSIAREGHAFLLSSSSVSERDLRNQVLHFETVLGFPPILGNFTLKDSEMPLPFRLVLPPRGDSPAILRGKVGVAQARQTAPRKRDTGLALLLTTPQLECLHHCLDCAFVGPGEVLYRFCVSLRQEHRTRGASGLISLQNRRDGLDSAGRSDGVGILGRNRERVALAARNAIRGDTSERVLSILYSLTNEEVGDIVHKRKALTDVFVQAGLEQSHSVRTRLQSSRGMLLLGLMGFGLVAYGILDLVDSWLRKSQEARRTCLSLLSRVADFGKLV